MSLPQKFYIEHLNRNTGYRPNWLPDRPLRIGDIGKLEDGLFTLYTTLEQQQIKCLTRESPSSLDVDYTSSDSVEINFNLSTGKANTSALQTIVKGSLLINFKSDKGLIFQISGAKKIVIENLAEIENAALQRYKNKTWPKEWVIVSELIITDHATIIISTSSNNTIELACDAPLGFAQNKLADPSLNMKLVRETGSSTKIIGAKELTPLYQVKGVYKPFLRKPEFRKRADATTETDDFIIEDLTFDQREL